MFRGGGVLRYRLRSEPLLAGSVDRRRVKHLVPPSGPPRVARRRQPAALSHSSARKARCRNCLPELPPLPQRRTAELTCSGRLYSLETFPFDLLSLEVGVVSLLRPLTLPAPRSG